MKNTDGGCFSAINSKANKFYSKGVLVLFCLIYCLVLFRRLGKNLSFNYNPAVQIILMACWAFLTAAGISAPAVTETLDNMMWVHGTPVF